MRFFGLALCFAACVWIANTGKDAFAVPGAKERPIKIKQTWNGGSRESRDDNLWQIAPQSGFIKDEQTWKRIWSEWKPHAEVPEVNFKSELLLVASATGPNTISVTKLTLDDNGNVAFLWEASERGGSGFVFRVLKIDRAGVRSINGKKVTDRATSPDLIKG